MNDHILNADEINNASGNVTDFSRYVEETKTNLQTVITLFESEPSVQSFYVSGNFGNRERDNLRGIVSAIVKYEN